MSRLEQWVGQSKQEYTWEEDQQEAQSNPGRIRQVLQEDGLQVCTKL